VTVEQVSILEPWGLVRPLHRAKPSPTGENGRRYPVPVTDSAGFATPQVDEEEDLGEDLGGLDDLLASVRSDAEPKPKRGRGRAKKEAPAKDFKAVLWASADKLRAQMDAAEYKHLVLGLIFLKYISYTFAEHRAKVLAMVSSPDSDFYIGDDPADHEAALEDRDYYTQENVFWVPADARWESLRARAKQPDIGQLIDKALVAIENENPTLRGKLDKRFGAAQLEPGRMGELVDLFSTIGFAEGNRSGDVLGEVYEYFLGQFASAEGKKGGQFYTPAHVVKTLVAVLAPHKGRIYDPCCGSGGMFVQSEKFIEAHGGKRDDASIYGQESNPTTWRLAAMNLAIRGFNANLGQYPFRGRDSSGRPSELLNA